VVAPESDPLEGMLVISVQERPEAVLISAVGELDILTAPRFRVAIEEEIRRLQDDGQLVLNLAGLTFLGSRGLQVLGDAANAVQHDRSSPTLRVVTGGKRVVLRPIELIGLDAVLRLYDDVDTALADSP
jgi:anti-sigma B factor antagonist